MELVIKKPETEEEILGRAEVHRKTWQAAYRGLIPDSFLFDPAFGERCERIARRQTEGILIAKDGERVIGLAGFGRSREEDRPGDGEIFGLYVLPEYWGRGVGYALMNEAALRLDVCAGITLWVLEGNERAIRFYERYGFRFDGREQTIMVGEPRTELRMRLRKS